MPRNTEQARIYMAERARTHMEKARAHLGGACIRCGTTENLDFDHIDPSTKTITISLACGRGWSWERILTELAKCQLLCRPHHQEKTSREARARVTHGKYHAAYHLKCNCDLCREFKTQKTKLGPRRTKPLQHGTYSGYKRELKIQGWACPECKKANNEYMSNYRKSNRL